MSFIKTYSNLPLTIEQQRLLGLSHCLEYYAYLFHGTCREIWNSKEVQLHVLSVSILESVGKANLRQRILNFKILVVEVQTLNCDL